MTNTLSKRDRGTQLLEEAAGDQDLLGVALLCYQGALDEHIRSLLSTNPALSAEDQAVLSNPTLGTAELVDLARRNGDLTREQAWRILEAERLRVAFSSGEPFRGSPSEVRSYGRFVADLCGDQELATYLAGIPTAKLAAALDDTAEADDDADPVPAGGYYSIMRWVPGIVLVAVLAAAAWALLGRTNQVTQEQASAVPTIVVASDSTQEPVKAATIPPNATLGPVIIGQGTPTALPSPTAATRQGQIVRLDGGPGWLHEEARFDSPTLPIRLSEGQIVAILGQQQTDTQGTVWVYVAIGGYTGWSPLNNVDEVR